MNVMTPQDLDRVAEALLDDPLLTEAEACRDYRVARRAFGDRHDPRRPAPSPRAVVRPSTASSGR